MSRLITLALTLLVLLSAVDCRRATPDKRSEQAQRAEQRDATSEQGRDVSSIFRDGFAEVAERIAPAVVNVSSIKIVRPPASGPSPFFDDPDLFGRGQRQPRGLVRQSIGSGVLISRKGEVVTSYHVVQGGGEVRVTLADKRELVAKIVGADPKTDIALLRIPGDDFPFIQWGDSSKVRVGQFVLAFGDPLSLGPTVTAGIISAVGRGNVGIVDYEDFLQTDASINPGNSGGPLVNVDGELVGINAGIATSGGRGNQGIGFAVPSNLAREVVKQVQDHGRVIRGWLGVTLQDVTPAISDVLGLETPRGALVIDVPDKSPAAGAGLRRGDVIVELDGHPVADSRSLRIAIAEKAPGTAVRLGLIRRNQRVEVTAKLRELPDEEQTSPSMPSRGPA